jgi:quercetin dioxygenase-like cupin family protein
MTTSKSGGSATSGAASLKDDSQQQSGDRPAADEVIAEADEESFPASDAPGWIPQTTIGPPSRKSAAGGDRPSSGPLAVSTDMTMLASRHPLSAVIDIHPTGAAASGGPSTMLAKTPTLEVRRLALSKGREIPTHQAPGEITVHCLEGRIAFTAAGATRELGAGQMILLAAGEPHSLVALDDATVLVTKVLPASPSAH